MLFLVNFSFGGEESRNKKGYGGGRGASYGVGGPFSRRNFTGIFRISRGFVGLLQECLKKASPRGIY